MDLPLILRFNHIIWSVNVWTFFFKKWSKIKMEHWLQVPPKETRAIYISNFSTSHPSKYIIIRTDRSLIVEEWVVLGTRATVVNPVTSNMRMRCLKARILYKCPAPVSTITALTYNSRNRSLLSIRSPCYSFNWLVLV